jgi:cell division protein ZapA (FtsZ GTPase activity inhibitor)
MRINQTTVKVAGKSYQLSGGEEPAYFTHLAEMCNRRIEEASLMNKDLDREGTAVAAALSLADEYVRAKGEANRLRRQLEIMNEPEKP